MQIAFYAPLKSPDHPVPSGDRLMGRLLIAALSARGHGVTVASTLRAFARTPEVLREGQSAAEDEIARLIRLYEQQGTPDLWFTYHPYYKAPDRIGPAIASRFAIPYVTAEASYSARRDRDEWRGAQAQVRDSIAQAALNLCITERDRVGLVDHVPGACVARLFPFIEAAGFLARAPAPQPGHMVAVAMMRAGDKMDSFRFLAEALGQLRREDWRLTVVGGGPLEAEVRALFAAYGSRVTFAGEQTPERVAEILSSAALYAWPGCGEAYGLAYLEAAAVGAPAVAQAIAGVPEVVIPQRTGLLTPAGSIDAYAQALDRLLGDDVLRMRLGAGARAFVTDERQLHHAAERLDRLLLPLVAPSCSRTS
ncbi:glycosyl transferase [Xaviernesmea oryzae]|uniref:Glycosyl transferase n=1 Tax=Xaviernesmea oryzae TaxID=464029 RepID=A0A1Q9B2Z7_9HYPH|nr:glycosyltransferase family 4 protein [Xaviernesmea oryzae]OLP62388.1 glycosyl transferase [Xaviernesmea oryzae]SEL99040.1 Glycosyltransferase involved in cell wall bisynthesis [Xaviernesmea oryzae]